jgi:hypothetical protein
MIEIFRRVPSFSLQAGEEPELHRFHPAPTSNGGILPRPIGSGGLGWGKPMTQGEPDTRILPAQSPAMVFKERSGEAHAYAEPL